MTKDNWRKVLQDCFEKIRLIERCKKEVKENFAQFCEFIAEPAFEALKEVLKDYGLKTWYKREGTNLIRFEISFPKSKEVQFSYGIYLPPNSIQMKLKLIIRGRQGKGSPFKERIETFMGNIAPENVLGISKEELIENILSRYRDFMIETLTSSE